MIDFSQPYYSMRGDAVVIHEPYQKDKALNESSLRTAIGNIKNQKATYATEEAWQRSLSVYEGALEFGISQGWSG